MSIIIQAGHKTSKSKEVMEKLYERGLSRPSNSYTHKMTTEQVSENLYKVLAQENMSSANEKMADNVMTDFLLANLDAENWGWESDKNLASLEYWQKIEPDVGFILVFDHPKRLFDSIETEKLTTESVNKIVDEWVFYHQGILKILEAGNDRSILIEGQCALQSIPNLNTQLVKIGSNIKFKSAWQIVNTQPIDLDSKKAQDSNFVSELIIDEILKNYPEAINIFNNLLNKADLKSSSPIYKTQRPKLVDLVESLGCVQSDTQSIIDEYELKLSVLEQEKSDLVLLADNFKMVSDEKTKDLKMKVASAEDSLKKSQDRVVSIESRLQNAKNNIQSLEAELKKKTPINSQVNSLANIADIEKENELLIAQLHETQDLLEECYLKNKELSSVKAKEFNFHTDKVSMSNTMYYGAADRVKQDLPYRLGKQIIKAKEYKSLIGLPKSLIKEYREFQKDQEKLSSLPSLEDYADYEEVKNVKKHLSYRVGNIVVERIDNPRKILNMPAALIKEIYKFKKTDSI